MHAAHRLIPASGLKRSLLLLGVKTKRNLLVNPSFEVFDSTNQPHGWTGTGTTTAITQVTSLASKGTVDGVKGCLLNGNSAVCGISQTVAIDGGDALTLVLYAVPEAETHNFPYSVRAVGGASDGLYLQSDGSWGASNALVYSSAGSQVLLTTTKSFTAPSDATSLTFATGTVSGAAVWIDGFQLCHQDAQLSDFHAFNTLIAPRTVDWCAHSQSFPSEPLYYLSQKTIADSLGCSLLIYFKPTAALHTYTDGSQDTALAAAGAAASAFGKTMYVALAEEFNGGFTPYGNGTETAAQFIAGWQYIVGKVRAAGGTNIKWVWPTNAWTLSANDPSTFYPGDAYVDYTGIDGFVNKDSSGAMSFATRFQSNYDTLAALAAKPILISSFGVGKWSGVDKTAWYTAMGTTIASNMPRLAGISCWNEIDTDGSDLSLDYTINNQGDTPAAAAALAAVVNAKPFA